MAEEEIFKTGAGSSHVTLDARVEIKTEDNGRSAVVVIRPPQYGGAHITEMMIRDEADRFGIVHGFDREACRRLVSGKMYDHPIIIAHCTEPKNGENGYMTFRFDKEHKLKPHQNEFGVANFRELNAIVPIRKKEIIADIFLPGEGTPGTDIFGKEIPATPGIPTKVSLGKNTLVTLDGSQVVAACDGHIVFGNGSFQVEEAVTINTDLDLSVGNISFFGDVHIKGNVMEGFSVNAGKNVRIDGSVFGGEVTAGGDVTIVGGCINTKLTCDGNADIGFCENSEIFVKGDVSSKQFAFCNVFCYGAVTAKGTSGVIAGGKVTSMHDVNAATIGSVKYTPTEIYIGDGSVLFARKREAEADLKESVRIFETAIKNLTFLKQRKTMQGGTLTESQQRQFRTETQSKLFHSMRINELQTLIDKLEEDIIHKDSLRANVSKTIFPGAKFIINFLTLEITDIVSRSCVTIVNDKIEALPL